MKISKRLMSIASLVDDCSFVLDVGCDHALLDIYLVQNKKDLRVIASDINPNPLKIAKENIKKYNAKDNIILDLADGIDNIKEEIDTIVLSGMGTKTILDILFKDKDKLKNVKKIIVSSNNEHYLLRKEMTKQGFIISDEQLILERNKYYPIILFTKGNNKYQEYELKWGPILIKKKEEVFKRYIKEAISKLIEINKKLSYKHIIKKLKLKKEIKELKKLL